MESSPDTTEEKTAKALTKGDFMQAVAQTGGPKAVKVAFDGLRLANDQLDKDYGGILKEYPRQWIAMGPDGMIANVPVLKDSREEDEEQALDSLFQLIGESGSNRNGYLVSYIEPDGGALIL